MTTVLIAVFIASLVGSMHCVGMCGPLVAVAVGNSNVRTHSARLLLQTAYHGGRLFSYSLVGMVCGFLGAGLDWGGSMLGIQRLAAFVVGSMMVLAGVVGILHYLGVRLPKLPGGERFRKLVLTGQCAAMQMRPLPRAGIIGLLTALLPCGWLYMFAILAASAGSPAKGAAVMAAFWLGNVPVLALLGISVQTLAATLGRRLPLAISIVVILFGLYTLNGRLLTISASAFEPDHAIENTNLKEQAEALSGKEPSCCQHDE